MKQQSDHSGAETQPSPLKSLVPRRTSAWLLYIVFWAVPALVTAIIKQDINSDIAPNVHWYHYVKYTLVYWWLWALLSPLIYKIVPELISTSRDLKRSYLPLFVIGVACVWLLNHYPAVIDGILAGPERSFQEAFTASLAQGIRPQWTIMNAVTYASLVTVITLLKQRRLRIYQQHQALNIQAQYNQLQTKNTEARLAQLKTQLRPHFLFNTLNGIGSLIETRDNDEAYQMLNQLSDLLRETLNHTESDFIELSEELAYLEKYLHLESLRHGSRLKVSYQLQEETQTLLVPALILQPLVENTIRHALPKSSITIHLQISARLDGPWLELTVSDDGSGKVADKDTPSGLGVGLKNVTDRLKLIYGDRAKLVLKDNHPGIASIICLPADESPQ